MDKEGLEGILKGITTSRLRVRVGSGGSSRLSFMYIKAMQCDLLPIYPLKNTEGPQTMHHLNVFTKRSLVFR